MLSVIGQLSACSSSKDVEAACELLTLDVLQGAHKDERSTLKEVLESIDGNAMLDSAKLRRRVRRLIETLEVKLDRSAPNQKAVLKPQPPSAAAQSSSVPMTMGEAIQCLQTANSVRDVESALNNLRLPEKVDGRHSQEFLDNRERLGAVLGRVAADSSLSNALVRKRIKKFCFVLASEEEQKVKKQQQQQQQQQQQLQLSSLSSLGKRKASGDRAVAQSTAAAAPAATPGKDLEATLRDLQMAVTAEDVDAALSNFTEASILSSKNDAHRAALLSLLQAKLEAEGGLNAKVKRKAKRVVEMLQKVSVGSAVIAAAPGKKVDVRQKLVIPAQQQQQQQPQQQGSFLASLTALAALKVGDAAAGLEAALALLPPPSQEHECTELETVARIKVLLARILEVWTLNSALKRRTKRALDGLPAVAAAASTSGSSNSNVELVKVDNPPPGKDLGPAIEETRVAATSDELLAALAQVEPGAGNTTTRRKLSRFLQGVLTNGLQGKPLSAKAEERCRAIMTHVQPQANSGAKLLPVAEAEALGLIKQGPSKKAKGGEVTVTKAVPANPHIIFIGQLAFESTAAEVEKLVRTSGVEGGVKVRLLTEPSGASRGMAFVELDTAAEQHLCLSLHHHVLNGRKINVEKSAGGRNAEKRNQKVAVVRSEQQGKIREKIDVILAEYTRNGVLAGVKLGDEDSLIKRRFYSYIPSHVQQILANFERASQSAGGDPSASYTAAANANQHAALDKIMDSFDAKLLRLSGKKRKTRTRQDDDNEVDDEEEGAEDEEDGPGEMEGLLE